MTTLQTQYSANFGDNSLPIAAADSLTTIGTDFIFDAFNAAGYAGGVLPADGASISGLVNLARHAAPAVPYAASQVRSAAAETVGQLPTFSTARGWDFVPGSKDNFNVKLAGVTDHRVCEVSREGFKDHLIIAWFRISALPGSPGTGVVYFGQSGAAGKINGGFSVNTTGALLEAQNSSVILSSITLNTLYQVAAHYDFDSGTGTTTVKRYLNGTLIGSGAGTPISSYVADNSLAAASIGAGKGWTSAMHGSICRVVREFTGASGVNPDDFVARDYALNASRLAAGA